MINSICIVRLSALGDVLMLVPLIRTLQKYLPQVQLTWVISRPAYDLVADMEHIEFIVIEKPKGFMDIWRFRQQMQHRVFDALLAPQASFRTNILYPFIRARRKIGYDAYRAKDGHSWFVQEKIRPAQEHTLEGFLKFAEPLGVVDKLIQWDLPITDEDYLWARAQLPKEGPILIVNAAASKPERSWLVERYVEVLRQAKERWQLHIVLTGGPGDFDKVLAQEIMQHIPALDLVGKTKPKQLLALISNATAVLCPDTGPSHMSAAVNTPVIALHAVTNPNISGPYTFQHLVVNCYPQAVQHCLGSTVDNIKWGTQVHGNDAMKLITVPQVMEQLSKVFEQSCH